MSMPEDYSGQQSWRRIQAFLPEAYRLGDGDMPGEEWWSWRGHTIHLDRFRRPEARAKVILFHGVGTNGRQMSTILGGPLYRSGLETVAIDMPGYGMTRVADGVTVSYEDWVSAGRDFVEAEMARDDRPVFLYGLSAGGMLAYHVAARHGNVSGVIGMTFLDQRIQKVADETASSLLISRIGTPLMHMAVAMGFGFIKLPMRMVSRMSALVNDRRALAACYADRTSAGSWMSQTFLSTYTRAKPAIEPEEFDVCPVLLTQPAADRWTPLALSELFLGRMKRTPVTTVMLENAGHYPLEEPGLTRMREAILAFIEARNA